MKKRPSEEAWIGDAVLTLYVRALVLREDQRLDNDRCVRMTSNQFLGNFGDPTAVEAEIGRLYLSGGLDAAFAWIESRMLPLFRKQEAKRQRHLNLVPNRSSEN